MTYTSALTKKSDCRHFYVKMHNGWKRTNKKTYISAKKASNSAIFKAFLLGLEKESVFEMVDNQLAIDAGMMDFDLDYESVDSLIKMIAHKHYIDEVNKGLASKNITCPVGGQEEVVTTSTMVKIIMVLVLAFTTFKNAVNAGLDWYDEQEENIEFARDCCGIGFVLSIAGSPVVLLVWGYIHYHM